MRKMMDSGLDIVGQMPNEWNFVRLRYLCDITTGDSDTQDADPDGEYPFYVRSPIVERSTKFTFNGEGILMAGDGAGAGRVFHHAFGKYAVHQRVYRLYNFKVNSNFLFYYISNLFPSVMDKGSAQSTVPSVRLPMLLNFEVCFPPLAEQKKIAVFLDEKCGEIDSIRSDVQHEIEILNDYKKSVITEAVTKGLNPKAKLKDSGIEWIGKIPDEWTIIPINYLTKSRSGGTPDRNKSQYWEDGTIPWMASGEVNKFLVYDTKEKITELATRLSNAKIVPANSVMVALNGQGKTKGMSAVLKIDAACNQSLCAFQCNPMRLSYMYLLYCFQSMYKFLRFQAGDDVRDSLAASFVKKQRIPLPSLNEQNAITSFIDEKCSAIDATIADKQKQLETLDEYKKSLIFEYVTGKKEVS